jgi:hypothetical protein
MKIQVMSARMLIALLWIAGSSQVLGDPDDKSVWQQRDGLSLSAGVFLPNYETTIRKSRDASDGSNISLEDDLGLDEDDVLPIVSIAVRPWSKHKFFFGYMSMDRDAKEVLDEDITFDGVIFPAGTDANTNFDIDMYRAGYTWSFLQNEAWELGFSLGAYWIDMEMKMSAVGGTVEADYNESEPFPMIGFSGSWLINEDWLIRSTAEAFSIDRNDTEGDFYNVRLECEYLLMENISIGAGYDLVRIDAEATKKNNKVKYDYDGALVFLRWHF